MAPTPARSLSRIASLLAAPARATAMVELMGGHALTATELAARADVAPSTMSEHVALLVDAGLLTIRAQGRHRYVRIASADVAAMMEAFQMQALTPHADPSIPADGIRLARTCYDHLAGYLGVALRDAMVERRWIEPMGLEHRVTAPGTSALSDIGLNVEACATSRRGFAPCCLDWTERRDHIAGSFGAALLTSLIDNRWLERIPEERELIVTDRGRHAFRDTFGLTLDVADTSASAKS